MKKLLCILLVLALVAGGTYGGLTLAIDGNTWTLRPVKQ